MKIKKKYRKTQSSEANTDNVNSEVTTGAAKDASTETDEQCGVCNTENEENEEDCTDADSEDDSEDDSEMKPWAIQLSQLIRT